MYYSSIRLPFYPTQTYLYKFVRTTMRLFNAIFFSIFSLYYECYLFQLSCTIKFPLISLDFAIDFAIFTMWLQTYGWMDGQIDGQNNGQTDRMMGGETNKWMDMQQTCKKWWFSNRFCDFYKSITNRRTDGPTDRRTDIPSYRDAIAASKNTKVTRFSLVLFFLGKEGFSPL